MYAASRHVWFLSFTIGALLVAGPLSSQETGMIAGRITIFGAGTSATQTRVTAENAAGRIVASTLTDGEGRYRLVVAPGSYRLSVVDAFTRAQSVQVLVTAGAVATANLVVTPAILLGDEIVVTADRVPERASSTSVRTTVVSSEEVRIRPAVTPVDHLRSLPFVDVITTGVNSHNVVVRGFNNIFSGSLYTLTDYRIASVPSLRVNFLHFIPQVSDDVHRMEMVLGPGSALYGPNTTNGVLHILTKSPLDDPGGSLSVAAGERSALQFVGRGAVRASDRFGMKVSGQYIRAQEWRFLDPIEESAAQLATSDFARWAALQPGGLSQAELQVRATRIAQRDFDIARWSVDARADWRPTDDVEAIFSAGRTRVGSGIELVGIGAAQASDWVYGYYQARMKYHNLFAQAYLNTSDAGKTFLLRTGAPIVDNSKLFVAQLQHSATAGTRQTFVYGADFLRTIPETGGTINGSRENEDTYDQYGVFVQSRTAISPKLDFVAAVREDWHTELEDPVFSPRAALIFEPTSGHTVRASYNRAFSTPTSLNLFLDIDGGPAGPLGALGYRVRAQGPGRNGIRLIGADGLPAGMRSPFSSNPGALLPVNTTTLYEMQLNALVAQSAVTGQPLPASLVSFLRSLQQDPQLAAIGILTLNPNEPASSPIPLNQAGIRDVPGIEPTHVSAFEIGYTGRFSDRVMLTADVWYSRFRDFTSPLVIRTPVLLLDGQQLVSFLAPRISQALMAGGVPQNQAQQQAQQLATGMAQIPGGVVSSADVTAQGADLLATYVNAGEVELWGVDVSATMHLSNEWSLRLGASLVSDHHFCLVETTTCPPRDLIALNASKSKSVAALTYGGARSGLNGELRFRHTGGFPANSADYVGLQCIGGGGAECVAAYNLMDLTLSYPLPGLRGTSLQLAMTNLFDSDYRSFVGAPYIGRFTLLKLRHEF